jgi:hypothetical protein
MFHLFDKVYLDFDTRISSEIRRIVISEKCGSPVLSQPTGLQQEQFFSAKSISEIIGVEKEFVDELKFFKELKMLGDIHNKPIVVYCDKNSFLHLFISWHKSILQNISSEILWKIFRFFIEKETYLSKISVQQSSKYEDRPNPFTFLNFQFENWNQIDFEQKYDEISINQDLDWNKNIVPSLGIEYLLTSYMVSPTTEVVESLKNRILLLSCRSILAEIYESKFHLIRHYQNKKLHNILNVSDIENIQQLFSHSRLSIYKDPDIWDESNVMYPSSEESSLNVFALNEEKIMKLIDAFKLVRIEFDGMNLTNPQFEIVNRLPMVVTNTMTNQQLSELLNNELFFGTSICESVDMEKVNVIFVDWCLKLMRTNNTTLIGGLSIST